MASPDSELDEFVRNVSAHIGLDWMAVARSLGFTKTEVDSIEHRYPQNLEEQIYQFFYQWRRKEGDNATKDMLYAAFYDGDLNELLKILDKIYNGSPPVPNMSDPPVPNGSDPNRPASPPSAVLDSDVVPDSTATTTPNTPPTTHPHGPPTTHPCTPPTTHLNRLDENVSPDSSTPNTQQHMTNNLDTGTPPSPETEQEMIRRKRLERFSSNISNNSDSFGNDGSPVQRSSSGTEPPPPSLNTGQVNLGENVAPASSRSACPFDLEDMVMVERPDAAPWYGVVRWIGELPGQPGQPTVGIEMDDVVPGGSDGSWNGVSHFQCEDDRGLFLPVRMIKKDNRFDGTSSTPPNVEPPISQNVPQSESQNESFASNESGSAIPREFLERMREQFMNTTSQRGQESTASACSIPASNIPVDGESVLVFTVPADRVGIIIGSGGRNIQAVERETNTIIKLEGGYGGLTGNKRGVIRGSDENKKKALELIIKRLKKEESQRTAKAETIQIQENKVGLVIGAKGCNINAIRRLSEAAVDIKEAETGLASFSLFAPQTRDCVVSGSEEEVEKAKELIRLAEQGGNIEAGATLAALIADLAKLSVFVEENNM